MQFAPKFSTFLVFLLCCTGHAQVEDETPNSIQSARELFLAYGQVYHLKLDHTYSRLPKRGFNNSFTLGYNNSNSKRFFGGKLNFTTGQLGTKGNQVNFLTNYGGSIQFWYLKKIKTLKTLDLFGGLNLGLRAEIWFPPSSILRYGWDISTGLGTSFSLNYKPKPKLELRYRLDLQLLGLLWRPHNNGQQLSTESIQLENGLVATAFENLHFSQPFNSLYLDHSFWVIYAFADKWKVSYQLGILYKHITPPLLKKGYRFDNLIGLIYQF